MFESLDVFVPVDDEVVRRSFQNTNVKDGQKGSQLFEALSQLERRRGQRSQPHKRGALVPVDPDMAPCFRRSGKWNRSAGEIESVPFQVADHFDHIAILEVGRGSEWGS